MARVGPLAIAAALLGAIPCHPARADCKLVQIAQLPVMVIDNRPLIDVEINGQKIRLLVDTGMWTTMLWRPEAVRLGLSMEDTGIKSYGIGGASHAEKTRVREFKLGSIPMHDSTFLVLAQRKNDRFSGILGMNFLSAVTVEYDFAHGAMRLFQPKGCQTEQLMYWAPRYSAAALESAPEHVHQYRVPVELNGERILATLDSGAGTSIVSNGAAVKAGVSVEEANAGDRSSDRIAGIGPHSIGVAVQQFESIAVGDEKIRNVKLQLADLDRYMFKEVIGSHIGAPVEGGIRMLIGADFFLSHRIIIPSDAPMMLFTYAGGPVFQIRHNVEATPAEAPNAPLDASGASGAKPDEQPH